MNTHNRVRSISLLLTLSLAAMLAVPAVGMAAEPTVPLGAMQNFAILAGTTITSTGNSVITGDIGVSPGSSITGFPPGLVSGTTHTNDALAIQAQVDWTTAYNNAVGRPVTATLDSTELGGRTLLPGVYESVGQGALQLTGTLTLDAQGDPEAVFILKSTSGLTIAADSEVRLINGARFCRVFWPVESDATLLASATFVGHILARGSIWLSEGTSVEGQLLTHDGEVTLINNAVANVWCASAQTIGITKSASLSALPAPGPVTYTYLVTNPGTVVLSNIVVTDDKVSPVTYVSGDTNSDTLLQPGETWTYRATTNLAVTTTNIATVTGSTTGTPVEAVTATASYTVSVGPRTVTGGPLPKTATPWYNLLLASVAMLVLGGVGLSRATRRIND
ncbi:MAG: ice-binding family protein [Coriobacteriia bacterium]|nr:ice-binding family protein [Coriobacteriia bacterium]